MTAFSVRRAFNVRRLPRLRFGVRSIYGLFAFGVPLAIYVASLSSSVSFWDTGETQTVPYILGIMHPTGFPVFTLAGFVFSHLFAFGTVAWRLSLMSALATAGAAYLVYAMAVLLDVKRLVSLAGALVFACGTVVWSRGSRAEIHDLSLLLAALTIYYVVRWRKTGERRALYVGALAFGLGLANHGVAIMLAPGVAVLVMPSLFEVSRRTALRAAAFFAAPGLLYAYLPLRSSYLYAHRVDPTLELGLGPEQPFIAWDYGHPANLARFLHYISGGDHSSVGDGFLQLFSPSQFSHIAARFGEIVLHEFGFAVLAVGIIGLLLWLKNEPGVALGTALCGMFAGPYSLVYPEADQERYFLPAFWILAVLAAYGTQRCIESYLERRNGFTSVGAALFLGAIAVGLFRSNVTLFEQRNDRSGTDFVTHVAESTPDNAILIANWAYAAPLAYGAYVENRLGRRIVLTAWPGDFPDSYPLWLKTRPIYLVSEPAFADPRFKQTTVSADPQVIQLTQETSLP